MWLFAASVLLTGLIGVHTHRVSFPVRFAVYMLYVCVHTPFPVRYTHPSPSDTHVMYMRCVSYREGRLRVAGVAGCTICLSEGGTGGVASMDW